MTTFDIQKFEDLARENGIRYWDALEFMKALGYETWASFSKVVNKAIASCAHLGIDIQEVFVPRTVVDGAKVINTYKLTRFACLLVTMQADSKKPEVAQAQVALAAVADALLSQTLNPDVLARIEIRQELKSGESIMSGAAKSAGILPTQYGLFKDAGVRGMYNMSLRDLVAYKKAPGDRPLYDYMGKTELAANLFRVTQTAERINNQKVKGLSGVSQAAQQVGQEVRKVMLASSGVAPENIGLEQDINQVTKGIKSVQKSMTKLDASKSGKAAAKKKTAP